MKSSPLPEENAAGTILWNAISPYDGIADYEINKETALVKGMLGVLRTPEATTAIRELNLYNLIAQIEQYNNEVEALMAERIDKEAGKPNVNTSTQRKEANNLYNDVVQRINATATLNPSENVDELVARTNALIEAYRRVASQMRPGGSGNEKVKKKKNDPEG